MRLFQITGIFSLFLLIVVSCIPFQVKSQVSDKTNSTAENYFLKVPKFHFELTFPAAKTDVTPTVTEHGEMKVYHYFANMQETNDDNLAYQIDYNYMDLGDFENVEELFDLQRDFIFSEMNSKLKSEVDSASKAVVVSEEKINLNGISGRYFSSRMIIPPTEYMNYHRWYYHDGILYRLTILTQDPKFPNKSASTFFDSFKILDK